MRGIASTRTVLLVTYLVILHFALMVSFTSRHDLDCGPDHPVLSHNKLP